MKWIGICGCALVIALSLACSPQQPKSDETPSRTPEPKNVDNRQAKPAAASEATQTESAEKKDTAGDDRTTEPMAEQAKTPEPTSEAQAPTTEPESDQVITTASGLKYEDLVVGEGASPTKGKRVNVHYTGWLADGDVFNSSRKDDEPFNFEIGMNRVIAGMDEGVMGMKIGGKRKLIIPPKLAFGRRGIPLAGIPAAATLTFEVELLSVE